MATLHESASAGGLFLLEVGSSPPLLPIAPCMLRMEELIKLKIQGDLLVHLAKLLLMSWRYTNTVIMNLI